LQLSKKAQKENDICSKAIMGILYLHLQLVCILKVETLEISEETESMKTAIGSWKK